MIQIEIRPEAEFQLEIEEKEHGVTIERYIAQIVEARSAAPTEEGADNKRAVEEMLAFRREYKATLDGLKLTDLIHEGHRY